MTDMKSLKTWFILVLLTVLATTSFGSKTGSSCNDDEDCPALHSCENKVCVHKDLFPITGREVGGTIFILFLNCVMTAGGVGGGAAYVPYIMLIFQYTLKQSIFVAYTCVFGGGLGNLVNIIALKNPKTGRYMPNFNLNMIILPALMIGVVIGVLINRMLPPFVTNLVLLFVLGFSLYKNFYKLKANLAKEKKEKRDKKAKKQIQLQELAKKTEEPNPKTSEGDILPSESNRLLSMASPREDKNLISLQDKELQPFENKTSIITTVPAKENEHTHSDEKSITSKDAKAAKLDLIMKNELKFPFHKVASLLVNVVIIIIVGIIRGSKNFAPVVGVDWTCGWDFLWFGLAIMFYLFNLVASIYFVLKWQKEKLEVGYEFLPEEPILNTCRIITLMIGSVVAGIIGAIVALGGAIILGPILLDMHIPPAVSAATTGVFMIFAMFNTMFSTILNKNLQGKDLAWYIPLAFVFSFISSLVVNWYVKKTGKQSTVILGVMTGVLLGFGCVLALFIKNNVEDWDAQVKFLAIC